MESARAEEPPWTLCTELQRISESFYLALDKSATWFNFTRGILEILNAFVYSGACETKRQWGAQP